MKFIFAKSFITPEFLTLYCEYELLLLSLEVETLRLRIGVADVRADPISLDLFFLFLFGKLTGISIALLRNLIGSNSSYFLDLDFDLLLDLLLDFALDLVFLVCRCDFITNSFKSYLIIQFNNNPYKFYRLNLNTIY